jgi:hypothetical protein
MIIIEVYFPTNIWGMFIAKNKNKNKNKLNQKIVW